MRLDDKSHQAINNIFMMNELPTIQAAYRMVREERHKDICKIAIASSENMAFVADKRKNYGQNRSNEGNHNYKRQNGGTKRSNN